MQAFPSALQKQIDLFSNPAQPIRNRFKAALFIIDDSEKIKPEVKERIKGLVRSKHVVLINICIEVLAFFDGCLSGTVPAPKSKQEIKWPSEIEEALKLLQRVFLLCPGFEVRDVNHEGLYKVLANMLRMEMGSKYRKWGFFILVNYLRQAQKAKLPTDTVTIPNP